MAPFAAAAEEVRASNHDVVDARVDDALGGVQRATKTSENHVRFRNQVCEEVIRVS